jgi:hypothetical protein
MTPVGCVAGRLIPLGSAVPTFGLRFRPPTIPLREASVAHTAGNTIRGWTVAVVSTAIR